MHWILIASFKHTLRFCCCFLLPQVFYNRRGINWNVYFWHPFLLHYYDYYRIHFYTFPGMKKFGPRSRTILHHIHIIFLNIYTVVLLFLKLTRPCNTLLIHCNTITPFFYIYTRLISWRKRGDREDMIIGQDYVSYLQEETLFKCHFILFTEEVFKYQGKSDRILIR